MECCAADPEKTWGGPKTDPFCNKKNLPAHLQRMESLAKLGPQMPESYFVEKLERHGPASRFQTIHRKKVAETFSMGESAEDRPCWIGLAA